MSSGSKGVADAAQGAPQVVGRDEVAGRLVAQVEDDAGGEAPLQWHLVNGVGWLPFRGRTVVVWGIDVGAGVRDRLHLLDRPAQPARVGQVFGPHAEEFPHLLQPLSLVRGVGDAGGDRLVGGGVLQGHAEVDQAHLAEQGHRPFSLGPFGSSTSLFRRPAVVRRSSGRVAVGPAEGQARRHRADQQRRNRHRRHRPPFAPSAPSTILEPVSFLGGRRSWDKQAEWYSA